VPRGQRVAYEGGTPPPAANVAPQPAGLPRIAGPGDVADLPVVGGNDATDQEALRSQGIKQGLQQLAISAVRPQYHPGRAAIDPHKLAAEGVPVAVQETVQDQIAETPEDKAARLEHEKLRAAQYEEQISAYKASAAASTAAFEEQRAQALSDQETAQAQITAGLERKKAIEDDYNRMLAATQKERDAAMSAKVDPNRLFHGNGGAANAIASAIAVGLGAFGSSLARSPNYAQQIVQAAIDRDVDSQRDQINRKGQAAQNAVSEVQRKYGLSLDEAASFVKEQQLRYSAARMQMQAAKMGGAEVQQKAAPAIAAMMAQADKEQAQQALSYKGRKATQYAVIQPQAATAGYFSGPTGKDVAQASHTVAEQEKAFPGTGGKTEGEVVPGLARSATAVDTGLRALPELQDLSQKAGFTGQVIDKVTGLGADTELTTASQHMAYNVASAEVNGMVPDPHRVEELTNAFASKNPITRERNIKMARDILMKKKKSIESISSKTAKVGTINIGGAGGVEE